MARHQNRGCLGLHLILIILQHTDNQVGLFLGISRRFSMILQRAETLGGIQYRRDGCVIRREGQDVLGMRVNDRANEGVSFINRQMG